MGLLKKLVGGCLALASIAVWASCGNENKGSQKQEETTTSGSIEISIDEAYRPVMEQQLKVFDSSYPKAHIKETYTSEKQCFEDLYSGKSKLIIVSRDLGPEELAAYKAKGMKMRSLPIAMDALAVIVNNRSQDSFMTVGQLQQILLGKFARPYDIAIDNGQSSTSRFILDSLIPGQQISSKTYSLKTEDAVVEYVANNQHALGLLGVNALYDPNSGAAEGNFRKDVRVVALRNDSTLKFYQPYQAYLALFDYPLNRDLYFITSDNGRGLAAGFANFLCSERGQLLFNKARLVPLRVQLNIREAQIK